MLKLFAILFYLIHHFVPEAELFNDYVLESIKVTNETSTVPLNGNITLKRVIHDNPKIFAEFFQTDNMRNYDAEAKSFYSPLGNTRYILLPYKLYRRPMCTLMNNQYRKMVMYDLHNYSNLPFTEDGNVPICDLMKPDNYYFMKNYSIPGSLLPLSLAPGRYRVQLWLYKKHEKSPCNGIEISSLVT